MKNGEWGSEPHSHPRSSFTIHHSPFTILVGVSTANSRVVYDALKAGTVDAQDDPWDVVELFKFYEVQKYGSVTDHSWSGYNLLASLKVWQSLPADIQQVIERTARRYVALQRADTDNLNDQLRRDLDVTICELVTSLHQRLELLEDLVRAPLARRIALDGEGASLRPDVDVQQRLDVLEIGVVRPIESLDARFGKRNLLHSFR